MLPTIQSNLSLGVLNSPANSRSFSRNGGNLRRDYQCYCIKQRFKDPLQQEIKLVLKVIRVYDNNKLNYESFIGYLRNNLLYKFQRQLGQGPCFFCCRNNDEIWFHLHGQSLWFLAGLCTCIFGEYLMKRGFLSASTPQGSLVEVFIFQRCISLYIL